MDYFEKKQWIRIAVCAVLLVLATLAMTGVFSGQGPLTYNISEAGDETADGQAAGDATSGSVEYRADRDNVFSHVTVIATAENGALTSVEIKTSGEDDLMTDHLRQAWAQAILESGSAAPDALTGATLQYSAASVTEAVTEILEQIAGQ